MGQKLRMRREAYLRRASPDFVRDIIVGDKATFPMDGNPFVYMKIRENSFLPFQEKVVQSILPIYF